MNFLKGILLGVAVCGVIALGACNKPEPVAVAPAVVVAPNVASPVTVTPASTVDTAVVTSPQAVVAPATVETPTPALKPAVKSKPAKASTKSRLSPAEKAAYAKAKRNAERAKCLRGLVDAKAEYDMKRGTISDFGNVRDPKNEAACYVGVIKAPEKKVTQAGVKAPAAKKATTKSRKTPVPAAK